MNWIDRCMDRLLRAASSAPPRPLTELSFGAQARVVTLWRSALAQPWRPSLLPLFRAGLAFACVVLVATVALSFWQMSRVATEDWTLPNAVLNLALTR